jgi:hypothetical protein
LRETFGLLNRFPRMGRFVVLVLLLWLIWSAPAGAMSWERLGSGANRPVTDGRRFVTVGGRVFDDRAPEPRQLALPEGCGLVTASAGNGGLECLRAEAWWMVDLRLVDLATGAVRDVADPPLPAPSDFFGIARITGIGRRWAEVSIDDYHFRYVRYFDWRTGAVRAVEGSRETPDLDADDVARPLCGKVARPRVPDDPYDNGPDYGPVSSAGRWTVYLTAKGLFAWRCGRQRPSLVSRCEICGSPLLIHGQVVWATPDGICVQRLRDGRRKRVDTTAIRPTSGYLELARTTRWLVASVWDYNESTWTVYRRRLDQILLRR